MQGEGRPTTGLLTSTMCAEAQPDLQVLSWICSGYKSIFFKSLQKDFICKPLRLNKHGAALYWFMMPLFKDSIHEVECYLQSPVYVVKWQKIAALKPWTSKSCQNLELCRTDAVLVSSESPTAACAVLSLQAVLPTGASQSTFPSNKYLQIQRYLKYFHCLAHNSTHCRNTTAVSKMILSPKRLPPSPAEALGSTVELTWSLMWWSVLTWRIAWCLLFPSVHWRRIWCTTKTEEGRTKEKYPWEAILTQISTRAEMHVPFATIPKLCYGRRLCFVSFLDFQPLCGIKCTQVLSSHLPRMFCQIPVFLDGLQSLNIPITDCYFTVIKKWWYSLPAFCWLFLAKAEEFSGRETFKMQCSINSRSRGRLFSLWYLSWFPFQKKGRRGPQSSTVLVLQFLPAHGQEMIMLFYYTNTKGIWCLIIMVLILKFHWAA